MDGKADRQQFQIMNDDVHVEEKRCKDNRYSSNDVQLIPFGAGADLTTYINSAQKAKCPG